MKEKAQGPTKRHTVLLVDDDERVLQLLARLLQLSGEWELVGTTSDPTNALERAAALQPDLVLLDLWMPGMYGLDLVPQLCALDPPPRVVLLTGDQSATLRDQALALGASAYLDKLMPPTNLLAELRKLWIDPATPDVS